MGSGTAKMVYNKSEVERSSIGNIDAATDSRVVLVGVNRLRRAARSLLVWGERNSRVKIQIVVPLGMQKHVRLTSIVVLVFKKFVGFCEHVPSRCQRLPFGSNPFTH
jgi:hypothetical protein